jgi:hypothetical protein
MRIHVLNVAAGLLFVCTSPPNRATAGERWTPFAFPIASIERMTFPPISLLKTVPFRSSNVGLTNPRQLSQNTESLHIFVPAVEIPSSSFCQ